MKSLKNILQSLIVYVKKANMFFVQLVLIFFYIFGIGIAYLLQIVTSKSIPKSNTYWKDALKNSDKKTSFSSAY